MAAGLPLAVEASNPAAWRPAPPTPMSGVASSYNQMPPACEAAAVKRIKKPAHNWKVRQSLFMRSPFFDPVLGYAAFFTGQK
jgi:hypothetical protein